MKVIFDLDYTLMDTVQLHSKLAEIFDKENYREDYQFFFRSKGISFDGEKYLAILKELGRIDGAREKELKSKLAELMENMDDFLKPDAESVLKHFIKEGHELILITFGNKEWQEKKVKNLSIKKYFSEIIFEEEDKSKSEYLRSLGEGNEKILIINDNLDEAVAMQKILGDKAELRLVKREDKKEAEPHIKNLRELLPEEKRRESELKLKPK